MQQRISFSINSLSARLSGLYGALFFSIGVYLPFFPVWLKARGLDAGEIAWVLAMQIVVRMVSGPLFSFWVDRTGKRRTVLIGLAVLPLIFTLALTFLHSVWLIGLVAVSAAFFWAPILPMTEVIAARGSTEEGLDYGRMRLWGSLAFILASLGGGLALDVIDPDHIVWVLVVSHALIFLAVLALPKRTDPQPRERVGADRLQISDAGKLLITPMFLVFLCAAGLTQSSHAVYYSFGTLHWQGNGIPGGTIGILWSLGVIAEVVLFFLSGRALKVFSPEGLIVLGAGAAVLRWTGTALDPGIVSLVFLQLLHGLTFGATHLGVIHYIARTVPEHLHNTAQALYGSVAGGLLVAAATATAGPLYQAYGAHAYLAMSVAGTLALAGALVLVLRWR